MTTHRSERVGERIHQEISLVLDREISDPRLAGVTVTRVQVTGDLRIAKVYVTASGADLDEKETMSALERAAGFFRRHLAQRLDLRYAPEVRFYLDHSIEQGEHFLKLLDQVQAEEREAERARRTRKSK